MNEFIRCYIRNLHLSLLHTIQKESGKFNEWELSPGSEFVLKNSYGYTEGTGKQYELMLTAIAQYTIIAETKTPAKVKPSILWNDALNIADVLTLLTIARVEYCSTDAVEKSLGNNYSISWGLIPGDDPGIRGIIPIGGLSQYIADVMDLLVRDPKFLEENGIIPSIYWLNQAHMSRFTAPSVLEMSLYWMCLEVLAGVFNDTNKTGIIHKKERVNKFVTEKGYVGKNWDYLEDMITDWYIIRNSCFHEGKQALTVPVLSIRRQQVRDFVSLVLVNMLTKQDSKRDKEIADRMRAYK